MADIGATIPGTGALVLGGTNCLLMTGECVSDIVIGTSGAPVWMQVLAKEVWRAFLEGEYTSGDLMRVMAAVIAGKCSGGPAEPIFRDLNDTEDRVLGVADISGNRYGVVINPR